MAIRVPNPSDRPSPVGPDESSDPLVTSGRNDPEPPAERDPEQEGNLVWGNKTTIRWGGSVDINWPALHG